MTTKGEGEMKIELSNPQGVILLEISNKIFKRDDVALTYALCIRQHEQVDFKKVNNAIIKRWSLSGLNYIKKEAWRRINEN